MNMIAIIVNLVFIVNSIQIEEEEKDSTTQYKNSKVREREAKLWSKMLKKKKKQ